MRNAEDHRHLLAQAVLNVRSQRATSRRTLSSVMRLSPTTAGQYVDQLIATGHIIENGVEKGPMGRPKRSLTTNPNKGWFAGIEFNAERIQGVHVDFSGRRKSGLTTSLAEKVTPKTVISEISKMISALKKEATGPLLGIGVGVPGIVDPLSGIARDYAFIEGWKEVPLAQILRDNHAVSINLDNNLRVIALAERWFGGGRELDDYVILGPRSGFGVAIMKNGRLLDGAHHAAGEIGRWVWPLDGEKSEMHDALSSPAAWRRLATAPAGSRLPPDLHAALREHADSRGVVWDQLVTDYARVLGLLHLLLDSATYFLHGPLTALRPRFAKEVSDRSTALMPALTDNPPKIVISSLGDDAGALGAASQSMESWLPL
jgi:predicted NBD/HSP70 family sugar kinase